jgi:hypothetical protein
MSYILTEFWCPKINKMWIYCVMWMCKSTREFDTPLKPTRLKMLMQKLHVYWFDWWFDFSNTKMRIVRFWKVDRIVFYCIISPSFNFNSQRHIKSHLAANLHFCIKNIGTIHSTVLIFFTQSCKFEDKSQHTIL